MQLRAILLPISVAVACVAALAWYRFAWIPAHEGYLNERNLRSLRTIAVEVKSKVDNFDQEIDHAIESITPEGRTPNPSDVREYVHQYDRDLAILDDAAAEPIKSMGVGDPPHLKLQRDEGRNYLFLGYSHNGATLFARGDIEGVAGRFVTARREFDLVLLADSTGRTILQQSSSSLQLARVDRIGESAAQDQPPAAAAGAAGRSTFDAMRSSSTIAEATIGGTAYKVYLQPVQLSLIDANTGALAEWVVCGFVRADHFRAESSAIATTYWLWLSGLLAAVCLAVPLLKLRILSPRERFRRADAVFLAATTFIVVAGATLLLLDVYYFEFVVPAAVDDQLAAIAGEMTQHVRVEARKAVAQLAGLTQPALWMELGYQTPAATAAGKAHAALGRTAQAAPKADGSARIVIDRNGEPRCMPAEACRNRVLERLQGLEYPYFSLAVWNDDEGNQRIKWSAAKAVTPFINLEQTRLPYYAEMERARALPSGSSAPRTGVSVMQSPNTGENLTVFWSAGKGTEVPAEAGPLAGSVTGASLATTPISLIDPLLPVTVQFAVVDEAGRVLFHSNPAKNLSENFFEECENDLGLRSLVTHRTVGTLTAYYLGRRHRLHVTPLDLQVGGSNGENALGEPRWSLVVFQDKRVPETLHLETLFLAGVMLSIYALALAATWVVARVSSAPQTTKWFWPDRRKNAAYRQVISTNIALALVFVFAAAFAPAGWLLVLTIVLAGAAIAATFSIVTRDNASAATPSTWPTDFFRARASLLFIIAAAPAIASYHVAYQFEAGLFAASAQGHLRDGLHQRESRIDSMVEQFRFDSPDTGSAFRRARLTGVLWDIHVPLKTRERDGAALDNALDGGVLGSFARLVHRPFNEVAADVESVMAGGNPERETTLAAVAGKIALADVAGMPPVPGQAPAAPGEARAEIVAWPVPPARAGIWYWIISAAIWLGGYLFARYVVSPLFALKLDARTTILPAACGHDQRLGNMLLIGPPGARKTRRLHDLNGIQIFDVRTLSFPAAAAAAAPSATFALLGPAAAGPPDGTTTWPDALACLAPSGPIGIDHLEYRFDDDGFRKRMAQVIEDLVYRQKRRVWITSTRDPVEQLASSDSASHDADEWARVLQSFRIQRLGLDREPATLRIEALRTTMASGPMSPAVQQLILSECSVTPALLDVADDLVARGASVPQLTAEDALAAIGTGAEHFYQMVWSACSTDEQLALWQLAVEGVANPNSDAVMARLLSAGLVRRDPALRIMNETFRRFVVQAVSADRVAAWERKGVKLPWGSITTMLLTLAAAIAALLVATQQQLVDAWVGYVPTLAPAVPVIVKLFASVRQRATNGDAAPA